MTSAPLDQHGGLYIDVSSPKEYLNRPALLPESLRALVKLPKTVQVEGELIPVSVDQLCDPAFCAGLTFQRYKGLLSAVLNEISKYKSHGSVPETQWVLGTTPIGDDWLLEGKYSRLWESLELPRDAKAIFGRPPGELLLHPRLNSRRLLQLVRAIESRYGRRALAAQSPGGIRRRVAALAAGPLKTLAFGDLRFGELLSHCFPGHTGTVSDCMLAWAGREDVAEDAARIALLERLESAAAASFTAELESLAARVCEVLFPANVWLRNQRMFIRRFSAVEEEGNTLQVIGDEHGVTRERVRQITAKMTEAIANPRAWMPASDRAFEVLKQHIPSTLAGLEAEPAFHRAVGGNVSVRALLRFREVVCGEHGIFVGQPIGQHLGHVVDFGENLRVSQVVRSSMVKLCSHYGAAHISAITWLANEIGGYNTPAAAVERVLPADSRFEWLDRVSGWGWYGPDQAARVMNHLGKIFSVAGNRAVDIEDIMTGLQRNLHHGNGAVAGLSFPPTRIVIEMLRRVPMLERVQYDDFRLRSPADEPPAKHLSSAELMVYDIAARNGGVFARYEAREMLFKTGDFSEPTLHQILAWSPMIQSLGDGVYHLRGWRPSPDAIAKVRERLEGMRVRPGLVVESVSADEASFVINIGRALWSCGQTSIPKPVADWAAGLGLSRFELVGFPGRFVTVKSSEAKGWRYAGGLLAVSEQLGMAEGQAWLMTLRRDATCTLSANADV